MKKIDITISSNLNSWNDTTSNIGDMRMSFFSSLNFWQDSISNFVILSANTRNINWLKLEFNYKSVLTNEIDIRGPPLYFIYLNSFLPLAITGDLRYGR